MATEYIKVAEPLIGKEEIDAVSEVLLSGMYVSGKKVKAFEERFAAYLDVKHAIAVSNGTAALHTALAALNIGPGDEVVAPAMTFFSTITAILHQNAVPVFADVDENYCLDPDSFQKVITPLTKAVIPVHLFGHPAQMDRILEICEKHGIHVVEDCAQAHGAAFKGKKVGGIGTVGAFSFFATKNITTGEGGMITTNHDEIAKQARLIRSHGMINRDDHIVLGYNYRMTEMEGALGLVQLSRLDEFNTARNANSLYLLERLKNVPWLHIQDIKSHITHAWFWCPIRIDEEKSGKSTMEFVSYLHENGIGVRHRYQEPLYKQEMLLKQRFYPKGCPLSCPFYQNKQDYEKIYLENAEQFAGKLVGLPNHPKLTKDQLNRIIDIVTSFC